MQQGTSGNQSPRDLNPSHRQLQVTQSTQLQHMLRALAENSAIPISVASGSGQVQVLDTIADSQRAREAVSTPEASASGAVQGQTQVISPEHISVADYLSQSFAGRAPGVLHSSPQRSSEETRRTGVSVPATSSGLLALRDSLGYAPISPKPQALQHHGHGSPGRSSHVRSHPGQICASRSNSSKSESNQGSSAALFPIPISPAGSLPLPSSPVKINQTTTMSVATNQPPSEVAELRRKTLEEKRNALREVQTAHLEKLTEFFFLQQGHNMMDYVVWKKKPPDPHLTAFLKNRQLEEKFHERTISDESTVKVAGSSASVGIQGDGSTQLPPEVSAQTAAQQKKHPDGTAAEDPTSRKGLEASSASETKKRTSSQAGLDETPDEQHRAIKLSVGGTEATSKAEASPAPSRTIPSITVISATPIQTKKADAEETAPSVTKISASSSDVKLAAGLHKKSSSIPLAGQIQGKTLMKSTSLSAAIARERQATRQQSLSAVYDYTIGSQEMIVERAKQEAQVMQRIAELRRDGLWSAKRLPRVQEPPRHKTHWDYLLEEMQWLAADFAQERRWKRNAAKKIGREVVKYHRDQEAREVKAEKEEVAKLRRIAGNIAKEIKAFWANIEKVVQYKQQSRLDERRKKALDIQLDFIVGQTEKYSSWLTEGLNTSTANSSQGSVVSSTSPKSDERLGKDDAEFEPVEDESDDEETIDVEEQQAAKAGEVSGPSEIELLQKESELPIEELLSSLQEAKEKERERRRGSASGDKEAAVEQEKEAKEPVTSLKDVASADSSALESKDDKDFELSADEEETLADDDEETLEEQEGVEGEVDHKAELDDLAAEGDLPIEELLKRYQGAYDGDLEDSDEEEESEGSEEEDSSQVSSTEEEEEEEEEDEGEDDEDELKDVGMEYLINPDKENEELAEKPAQEKSDGAGPNREITDIAAAAQSIQPTGYTLSDTLVKTKVPFLLHHTLREYQHIGLDWLVTMHDKKLNGILADEMGLGKTIQTIAVLAHLACENVSWGPHLIVVPTSVMLNWEMEFKKWCPGFKILTYFGSQKERKLKRTGWTKTNAFHVCITSYKLVIQDHQAFRRKKWKYLVLDEAQNIKNFKSQRWQTLLNFSSQRRLLLTGTPLQNNLMELWSLMHFLMPHVFQSHREFKEWFSNPLGGMIEGTQEYNEGIIRRLHKVLRPFLLRRLKSQVEKQLPQKYEHVIRCRLSKRQRFLYDDFMGQTKTKETLSTGHFMSVINVLMQLRKVCNHPDLFEARPIRSPFIMVGLLYYTASLVHRAMEYKPLEHVSLPALNLCIADLEISQSAYAAHRACQLQTPRKLIEEIDSSPEPPPRPPKVKVKPGKLYPSPMALQAQKEARSSPSLVNRPSDRASPSAVHIHGRGSPSVVRVASPSSKGRPGSPGLAQVLVRSPGGGVGIQARTPQQAGTPQILQTQGRPGTPPVTLTGMGNPRSPGTLTLVSQNPQQVPSGTPLQQLPGFTGTVAGQQAGQRRVVLQQQQVGGVGPNGKAQLITTQPITVQLQQGSSGSSPQQGQRLIAGQIRQLPQGGIVQIIQTSGGQQIIRPAVQLTSQSNLVQGSGGGSSSPQVVQRSGGGSPQVVLSHTAAQLQAAQQLHQSIQRQLTAQGISPSQAQAVASQLSKVTAAQSPLQMQQRQILLQQQQQQQQQVVINAKTGSVATTQGTQTVTITTSSSSSSRPSSPSVSIVQVVNAGSPSSSSAKTVNIGSPLSTKTVTIGSPSSAAKAVTVASPSTKTISVASAAERLLNAASPGLRVTTAGSPTLKVTTASSPGSKMTTAASALAKATVVTQSSTTSTPKVTAKKEESKEAKEAAEKLKKAERKRKASPLYLESLDKAREAERKATLSRIATFNHQRCNAKPVYGQDLFTAVSIFHTSRPAGKRRPFSNGVGIVHCHHALIGDALRRVEVAFKKTRALRNVLHTPMERLEELQEITKRYTFVVPTAAAPLITMHTSHPPPSLLTRERRFSDTLSAELKHKTWCLHPIENLMRMDFPELRLIQYDCGKLQTLDQLLRKLKAEGSRTLIFTQMTKMLDVLERFLNYHGYIYLRLDGTTKVEQRQILMERFNKDSRIFCFILSTRSGGIGVNLTGANAVIFYDSDWNPTMDAQAQDRCHRIGQTRDVHIYRLISEMSIEENILKKSNQKRLLIDVSIEGGNFTTAFFKKNTIKDIFNMSKETGKLQDMLEITEADDQQPKSDSPPPEEPAAEEAQIAPTKPLSQLELEKALARAEDDTDVKAASRAHAEQDAELAEFDESIPYEGEDGKGREETSRVELELAQLDDQLTPIERYAVVYLEDTLEPITAEELKEAEEQVEAAKRDWELGRLQALKEQEERDAELEEDEVLYTYSREDAENQVHKGSSKSANKRKDRSKGSLDRDDREARASRRNSRDRGSRMGSSREGGRTGVGSRASESREVSRTRIRSREGSWASGSREGSRASSSRASSRAGSPPPVIERPTRSRSRASSGASGAEGDTTPRQTRSRTTSSGSASDMPLSPRQGDRASRMAEREQRRTERKEQAERISPRPIGRPRKRPREDTDEKTPRSPERVVPRRKGSASEEPVVDTRMSLRRAKSPDQGAVFSDGETRTTRSGRTLRRSGSVSDDKGVGHLEPVEEAKADVDSDATIIEEVDMSNGVDHIENPLLENLAASSELGKAVMKEGDKKTRNLFDLVNLKLKNAESAKDQTQQITAGVAQGSIKSKFEKLDTKNLFANLARRLKKRHVSGGQPLQPVDEDGNSDRNHTLSPSKDVKGDIPKGDVQSDNKPTLTNAVQNPPVESVNAVEIKCVKSSETKDNNDVDVISVTPSPEEENMSTPVTSEESYSREKDKIESDSLSKVSSDSGKRAIDSISPTLVESNVEASSVECEVVAVVDSMLSSLDDKLEHESQSETQNRNRTDQSKPDVLLHEQVAECLEPSTPQATALSKESEPSTMPKSMEEQADNQELKNEEKPSHVCETSDSSIPTIDKDLVNEEVKQVVEQVEDPSQSKESPACGGQETSAPESTSNTGLESLETLPDAGDSSINKSNDGDKASIGMSDVADDEARITSLDSHDTFVTTPGADDSAGVIILEGCDIEMVEIEPEHMDTSETSVDQGEESATQPMEVSETIVELGTKRRVNMIRDETQNISLPQEESKETAEDVESQSMSDIVGVTKETDEDGVNDSVHKNEMSADLQDKTASNSEDAKEVDSISNAIADNSKTIPDNKDERMTTVVPKLDLSQLDEDDETGGEVELDLKEFEPSTNAVESKEAFENKVAGEEEQVPDTAASPKESSSEKISDLLPSKEINSLKTEDLSEKKTEGLSEKKTEDLSEKKTKDLSEEKLKQILEKPLPNKPSSPVQKTPVTVPAPGDSSSETSEPVADENEESSEEEGSLTMPTGPPKPTRSVREIMNLGLPGEKPIILNVDSPSGRTRSRQSSDAVRQTRSRAKSTPSPRVTPVRVATKASPRPATSSKKPAKPQLASSTAKRSPRLSASADSSLQTRMKRALRSADPS